MGSDQRPLANKVAVVTGSSSGIGAATAVALAEAGAEVVVHAKANRVGAENTVAQARSLGGEATCLMADLGDREQQLAFLEQAWQWKSGVDIWVNNAGADVLTGTAAAWSFEEKFAEVWRVDVVATMLLSRAIGARMKARVDRGDCTIINIGWDQAAHGMAGDSGEMFAASKGAIMAFSRSLAQSLAPRVRVNCVAPGWIRTAWGSEASPTWQSRALGDSLLSRWGIPADVAQTIAFLASPVASFINGQVLPVNGGFRYGAADSGEGL